jgi:hypothetical protein
MRRVVIEMPLDDFVRLKGGGAFYRSIESFAVLQVLRSGPGGTSLIVRIRPKDPTVAFEELAHLAGVSLQLIDRSQDTLTCLMKSGHPPPALHRLGRRGGGGYLVPPIEVQDGKGRLTFVGTARDVGVFLTELRRHGLHYRTVSISDLRVPATSPLTALTDKQLRVVSAAYHQGYYDRPRRVSSKDLARRLGLSSSTLVNHRLKAERRLLSVLLSQAPLSAATRRE